MEKICFTTTVGWNLAEGFGCASLGLAGICDNTQQKAVTYPYDLEGTVLTGSYDEILDCAKTVTAPIHAAIVLFGNAGGENFFSKAAGDHFLPDGGRWCSHRRNYRAQGTAHRRQ